VPVQIEALKTVLEQGDAERVERKAHSLKGAAVNLNANELAAATLRLEQIERERKLVSGKPGPGWAQR
jgi:HPt (histidine-containing phosphotransfer) domain-containing protein